MRLSNHMTSRGGSGHFPRHHGQGSHRGQRNTHRASVPFDSYEEGSNMERGMVSYDSNDEDCDAESDSMHRGSRGQEDLYRQSHFE